ncbi:hypothetical protein GCM10027035_42640 [Emticicia sediminis]
MGLQNSIIIYRIKLVISMKKIFILLFYICCLYSAQSQNSVETNPNGTTAIISSKGVGSTLINNAKAGIYSTTGTSSINSNVTALQGYAANSTLLNVGVYGIARGNSSNYNYAIQGDAYVNSGTGIALFGNCSTSSINADYLYGGQFNTGAFNGTNGSAIATGVRADVFGEAEIAQRRGFYSNVEGASSESSIGVNSSVINTGNGLTYGGAFIVSGSGSGTKYGVFSNVNNTANTTAYGGYFEVLGTGTGTKYGIYTKATGSGSLYAAVLDGKVGIGTNTVSSNEILEINGRTRIRRNTLPAGIWFNNNVNGNTTADGAFVGMNNEAPGSESVGFWLNNSFRLTVDRLGNTSISNNLNVANSITVDNSLNVGNTLTVTNNLAASGGITIGGGQVINKIIKVRVTGLLPSFSGSSFTTQTYTVNGAAVGDVVVMTPESSIGNDIIISEVFVSANNTVTIRYYKPTSSSTFPGVAYAFNFVVYK